MCSIVHLFKLLSAPDQPFFQTGVKNGLWRPGLPPTLDTRRISLNIANHFICIIKYILMEHSCYDILNIPIVWQGALSMTFSRPIPTSQSINYISIRCCHPTIICEVFYDADFDQVRSPCFLNFSVFLLLAFFQYWSCHWTIMLFVIIIMNFYIHNT